MAKKSGGQEAPEKPSAEEPAPEVEVDVQEAPKPTEVSEPSETELDGEGESGDEPEAAPPRPRSLADLAKADMAELDEAELEAELEAEERSERDAKHREDLLRQRLVEAHDQLGRDRVLETQNRNKQPKGARSMKDARIFGLHPDHVGNIVIRGQCHRAGTIFVAWPDEVKKHPSTDHIVELPDPRER